MPARKGKTAGDDPAAARGNVGSPPKLQADPSTAGRVDDIQRALLGSVLLYPGILKGELPTDSGDFPTGRYRAVWDAVVWCQAEGLEVGPLTVADRLRETGVDGWCPAELAGLYDTIPDGARVAELASILRRERRRTERHLAALALTSADSPADRDAAWRALEELADRQRSERDSGEVPWRFLAEWEDVEPPAVVVPRLVWRGNVTLLAGREKLGKSTLARAAVGALSNGAPFLGSATRPLKDGDGNPRPILYATEEAPAHTVAELRRWGAHAERVAVLPLGLDAEKDLRQAVGSTGAGLAVVDSLAAYAMAAAPESGSASQWAGVMRPLAAMARELDVSILLLHHARKGKTKGTGDGYRDSSEIGAAVDVVAEMEARGRGAPDRRVTFKGRNGSGSYVVRLVDDGDRPRFELLPDTDRSLTDRIAEHPEASNSELAEMLDTTPANVRKVRSRLRNRGSEL